MIDPFSNVYLVVIAGGSGTRFWPKSTTQRPKQLLQFHPDSPTLLRQTLDRFSDWIPPNRRYIVTTKSLENAVKKEAAECTILAEPEARNTAPCIFWAAKVIQAADPNSIMLIMPADHLIQNVKAFTDTLKRTCKWAQEHRDLITLGITPTRPETGYGYLKTSSVAGTEHRKVAQFVEKPTLDRAIQFLQNGDYLWNGGMFVWKSADILQSFLEILPDFEKAWLATEGKIEKTYPLLQATSIDYGIMEKAPNVIAFPLDSGWDDLGSWNSLEAYYSASFPNHLKSGQAGTAETKNTVLSGQVYFFNASGNIVDAPGKTVSLLGVNDLIVVESGEVILVSRKDQSQDIKSVVSTLKSTRPDLV